ncbi:Elongator complex protein 3 [Capsicum baccatum]|uniref:Elongator complex protein 3 n=1 Tax=Capsicum baccatum TaxID=33114 RepID=A0A2G2W966_CAPBA|nr:Elongator complex protein 3 [Capsicum baccatum]
MVELSRRGKDVDLNALKSAACRKYGLSRARKLVEMIAALPDSERETLLPKLRAKPVRTASDYRDYFIRNLHDALSGHTSANVKT